MYKPTSGRRTRPKSSFGGNSNSRRRHGGGGNRNRSGGAGRRRGQNIDPARFVKAAKQIEQIEYVPEHTFSDFAIDELLLKNIAAKGFIHPSQIQDKSIPIALEGKDVVGIANTGTGKTAAFLLPLLTKLMHNKGKKVLIIAPTRELAMQIQMESRSFAKGARLFDVLLIGGAPIGRQFRDLKRQPEIIIGTPGRIKDHLERNSLRLDDVDSVVLDEVDRMLDMGFINDIRTILSQLPAKRQSLFYSATMNPTIESLINTFTHSPIKVMARTSETSDNVDQSVIRYAQSSDKMDKLHDLLVLDHVEKTIIFAETKRAVERLSNDLVDRGFAASAMHGGKSQGQRQRALRSFKESKIDILVATDVAARGIDVDGISHVINYEIPQTYDDYTHRIGRTGRNNTAGYAVTFVTHSGR